MKAHTSNLSKSIVYRIAAFGLVMLFAVNSNGQEIVDKTVATVSDGVRTELITFSDLNWQLALVPGIELQPASSDDLNQALQLVIRQRLIALEAERLPSAEPTKEEVDNEINRILAGFPSIADFVRRLRSVGFSSVDDENFQRMMKQRVAIEKYLDFRFRSFVVITPDAETNYYQTVFVPDFKRRNPGIVVPEIETVRARINQILTEQKVETDIEGFLDNARARAEIVILNEV
ncbi:MAG: hypothetical protein HKN33_18160 [Pyrinomonadaceae bacterium]|nr:hypothetical protein [Pyrinomonadaceae bacterium]